MSLSTINAVQTRGTPVWVSEWITSYRLELSQDCATFSPLVDAAGVNVVKR